MVIAKHNNLPRDMPKGSVLRNRKNYNFGFPREVESCLAENRKGCRKYKKRGVGIDALQKKPVGLNYTIDAPF
ncbi:hypothetical protein A3841_18780 [Pontibacter flavimaris]|uniref:Uncharacterized protein n=1 Tax=Pontibacter flavimaris TaxID=1797110 RepID=A0A1Q5PDV4_9BACT|nr:hypothetical protein A3841_18780 [Pontibacter flavimaris]